MAPEGFNAVKRAVIAALEQGNYQHEARTSIDVKNLLATGEVSADEIIQLVRKCNGTHHTCSPHHRFPTIRCHLLKAQGWYVKFYFLDPQTVFISVHQ